jgi:anti-sigma28 factor (negative regulator of flagellin synthesis)
VGQEGVIGFEATSPDGASARIERLVELQTAIADGRYHVSAAELAQKLMEQMVALQPGKIGPAKN